ncbi:hypothetical protein Glove_194g38 [Diversispora epigaea]|uniref:Uncharacterized protein n=1 Tax=Diversispora epigaea TaxID=1348612 RepID=A0A397IQZ9_9GLOM|nr:hypothetical protein Glove_194g38 [Diversispora epigaea]
MVRQHFTTNNSVTKPVKFRDFTEKFRDFAYSDTLIGFGASTMYGAWATINFTVDRSIGPVNEKLRNLTRLTRSLIRLTISLTSLILKILKSLSLSKKSAILSISKHTRSEVFEIFPCDKIRKPWSPSHLFEMLTNNCDRLRVFRILLHEEILKTSDLMFADERFP